MESKFKPGDHAIFGEGEVLIESVTWNIHGHFYAILFEEEHRRYEVIETFLAPVEDDPAPTIQVADTRESRECRQFRAERILRVLLSPNEYINIAPTGIVIDSPYLKDDFAEGDFDYLRSLVKP